MRKMFWGFVLGAVLTGPVLHISVRVVIKRYTGNWPDL